MKVLLINPPVTHYRKKALIEAGLPLGLLYIAAILEREHFKVEVIDSLISKEATIQKLDGGKIQYGLPWEVIGEKIKEAKPDVIGVTCQFTSQSHNAIKLVNLIKEINPSIYIIVGGPHVSASPREFLEETQSADVIIMGEGECTILDVMRFLQGRVKLEEIEGICFRRDKNIIINPKRDFIRDLDELPLPSYHLIDMELFFSLQRRIFCSRSADEERCVSIITSRGCPFNCVFCSINLSMGRKWRFHSADYVIRHLKHLILKYNVKYIHFEDDNFTFNLPRCETIMDAIVGNSIKIKWDTPNGIRIDKLTPSLIHKMKDAGCRQIAVGIESGDQEVLSKIVRKSLDLNEVVKIAKFCKECDVLIGGFFLIGFPGEKKENMINTVRFALFLMRKYRFLNSRIGVVTPLPGTELFRICEEKKLFTRRSTPELIALMPYGLGKGLIETADFSMKDLKKIIHSYNRQASMVAIINYLKNPKRLLSKLVNKSKYRLRPPVIFGIRHE